MHRQYLKEGKTQMRQTYLTQNRQPRPGTGQAWAAQPGRLGKHHTRLPVTAGRGTMTNGGETDHGELSPHQRSLHISGYRMRQHIWEGVCILYNNRYHQISIDIHTQMRGETFVHIVIGEHSNRYVVLNRPDRIRCQPHTEGPTGPPSGLPTELPTGVPTTYLKRPPSGFPAYMSNLT